jgi:hypothetical protein
MCVFLGAGHWFLGPHTPVELHSPNLIVANIAGDILAVFIIYCLGKLVWVAVRRKRPPEKSQ